MMAQKKIRLGINIDHVATIRQLRNTPYPDVLKAALECISGGADQITVHLREDRRHIQDEDVRKLKANIPVDLNLEMALTEEMIQFALQIKPHSVCIVPEKREERTTEGGLNLKDASLFKRLQQEIKRLQDKGILVSLFIEPTLEAIQLSKQCVADAVEFHTGTLCLQYQNQQLTLYRESLENLKSVAGQAKKEGLCVHAGHGIDYEIIQELVQIPEIEEYNIGHAVVAASVFYGIKEATQKMKRFIEAS